MNEIIADLVKRNTTDLDVIVEIVCNTIKAKAYYQKGGWELVYKEFRDCDLGGRYLNPNMSVTDTGLYMKLNELGIKTTINITNHMTEIQNLVNKYFDYPIVEYRVDRKSHYFHVTK